MYDIWQEKILTPQQFVALDSQQRLEYLALFGVMAPTTRNTVPQRFRFDTTKNVIEIWLDRCFILAESDKHGKQSVMSLGCVIKNIEVAASAYGYSVETEVVATDLKQVTPLVQPEQSTAPERYLHVVNLHLSSSDHSLKLENIPPEIILQKLITRKVIRGEYDDRAELPSEIIESLQTFFSQNYPTLELRLLTTRHDLHTIGKFQEDADRTVFEDPAFTKELGNWLLENSDQEKPYGMRGYEFGFDDAFAQKMHRGLLQLEPLLPDQIAALARGGKVAIESCSAVAVISISKESVESYLLAGKAYQDLVLLLLEQGFIHSVHAGIIEVEWINSMFAASVLHTRMKPAMLFRIGKPKREVDLQRPKSRRPSLKELSI